MAKWPYNTIAWRNLRKAKLRETPHCEPCHKRGRIVSANTVDHVRAIAAGGDPFPPLAGIMSMCHACHNTKTAAMDRRGGKGVAFPGCDANGYPIDPKHPTYQGYTPPQGRGQGEERPAWGSRFH